MPEHALYYPEWGISDPVFLTEALLYWDRLGCIVPTSEPRPMPWHADAEVLKLLEEAHEKFVSPIYPTEEQKLRAHERIKAFAALDPPEWCRPENLAPQHRQVFSAEKISEQTLRLLHESGWARPLDRSDNLHMQLIHNAAADLVLGAVADACSSPTMSPVTDDPGSFSANCNLLLTELGAQHGITFQQRDILQRHQPQEANFSLLLTKIPHLSLDKETFQIDTLRRILRARKDPEVNERRKAFQRKVDEYLEKMRTVEAPERYLYAQEFQDDLNRDLEILKRELQRAGVGPIISKDGIVAVVVGALTGAIQLGIQVVLGLTGGLEKYGEKRREALDKHWSSWILSATTNRLTVW